MTDGAPMRLAVLGGGSWGATLAAHLARNGNAVALWCHDQRELATLAEKRHPPGVPELRLPEMILTASMADALRGTDAIFYVVPAQACAAVGRQVAAVADRARVHVLASKGIDLQTLRPLSDVLADSLPGETIGVVSGPCIAREVAQGIPTSVVVACADGVLAHRVQHAMASATFRVYRQDDVLGVEYAGACKNVIAIAAGVCDGLGFGANSKSALLTRGLAEMRRFVTAFGGNDQTIGGLAGLGDLCVTCFSPHSRNRRFGEALGRGETAEAALAAIGETVEGAPTARAVVRMAAEKGIQVPIAEAVLRIMAGEWAPREAVGKLMLRELKEEFS